MRKAYKRFLMIIFTIAAAVVLAAAFLIWVRPAVQTGRLEKLSSDGSPTSQYAELLPGNDEIFGWAEDLTDMGERRPGTEAGSEAQAYVKSRFEEFGLEDVSVIASKTTLYQCDSYSLTVGGEEKEAFYINYSGCDGSFGDFSTPEGGASGELVYIGESIGNTDVEGKIVVADVSFSSFPYAAAMAAGNLFYDPDHTISAFESKDIPYVTDNFYDVFFEAQQKGAAGYIGILTDYPGGCEYHNEDYAYVGGGDMSLPGVWVSNETGQEIIDAINSSGGAAEASIALSGSLTQVDAGAVIGYLPGRSEETIMVQSHYDSITTGGVEDASGCSCMMGMAKFWSQIPEEDREKTLLFIATDTHFSDYDTHDAVLAALFGDDCDIIANLCIEHVAREAKFNESGGLELTGLSEPRIIFVSGSRALKKITCEEFVRHRMTRTAVLPANILGDELFTDADEFYQEGLPVVNLISGPVYLYDPADTADMIAKEDLQPTVWTMSDILMRLSGLTAEEISGE